MLARSLSVVATALAVAAFVPSPATAQGRGGGHASGHAGGGGFHAGGGGSHAGAVGVIHGGAIGVSHAGGVYHSGAVGVYHGGAAAAHPAGLRNGASYSRGSYGYGLYGREFRGRGYYGGLGLGLGYPWYGYDTGYSPGIYDYGYAPAYPGGAYYDIYPTVPAVTAVPPVPAVTNNDFYSGGASAYDQVPYADVTGPPTSPNIAAQPAPGGDTTAHVSVTVPEDARVWFDNNPTREGGTLREFVSPPLSPGQNFLYDIKVRWIDEDGKEVTRTKQVEVRAGSQIAVDFTH